MFFLVEPEFFSKIYFLDRLFTIAQIAIVLICTLALITSYRFYLSALCLMLFQFSFLVITVHLQGNILLPLTSFISVYAIVVLVMCGVKSNAKVFLSAASAVYYTWLILNLLTIVIFPNGLYLYHGSYGNPCYLLGHRNTMIKVLLPGLLFVGLHDSVDFGKLRIKTWIYWLLMTVSVTLTWSVSALFGCLVMLLGLILYRRTSRHLSLTTALVLTGVASAALVLFNVQNMFADFITNSLGRDLTLSGRTVLWDIITSYVRKSPLIGYGIEDELTSSIKMMTSVDMVSSHNYILDTLYYGGVVASLLLFLSFRLLDSRNRQFSNSNEGYLIFWGVFSMLCIGITEPLGVGLKFIAIPVALALSLVDLKKQLLIPVETEYE